MNIEKNKIKSLALVINRPYLIGRLHVLRLHDCTFC